MPGRRFIDVPVWHVILPLFVETESDLSAFEICHRDHMVIARDYIHRWYLTKAEYFANLLKEKINFQRVRLRFLFKLKNSQNPHFTDAHLRRSQCNVPKFRHHGSPFTINRCNFSEMNCVSLHLTRFILRSSCCRDVWSLVGKIVPLTQLRYLKDAGVDLTCPCPKRGITLLFHIVMNGGSGKKRQLEACTFLLKTGVDVHVIDNCGRTVLETAVTKDSHKLVKLLLDWGARIRVTTAKHVKSEAMARMLLARCSNVDFAEALAFRLISEGRLVDSVFKNRSYMSSICDSPMGCKLLHHVRNPKALRKTLEIKKFREMVNFQLHPSGDTPLHSLVRRVAKHQVGIQNALKMVRMLKCYGADATIRNNVRLLPIDCLICMEESGWHSELMKGKYQRHAKRLFKILYRGITTPQTWLHRPLCQSPPIIDFLVEAGVSLKTLDMSGKPLLSNIQDFDVLLHLFNRYPMSFCEQLKDPIVMQSAYARKVVDSCELLVLNGAYVSRELIENAFKDNGGHMFLELITDRIDKNRLVRHIVSKLSKPSPECIRGSYDHCTNIMRIIEEHPDRVLEHGYWCNGIWFGCPGYPSIENIGNCIGCFFLKRTDKCAGCGTTERTPLLSVLTCTTCSKQFCSDCVLKHTQFDTRNHKVLFKCPACFTCQEFDKPSAFRSNDSQADVLTIFFPFSKHSRQIMLQKHRACTCCPDRIPISFVACDRGCFHCRKASVVLQCYACDANTVS